MSDQIIEDVLNDWAARQQIALDDVPPQVRFEVKERLLAEYLGLRKIIRDHGGVMPEDLPEVRIQGDTYVVDAPGPAHADVMLPADANPTDAARHRARGLALLAIARKIEEDQP